ncbi:ankyrin repeat domain-containing protein [Aquabacterium sp. A7-Y]|uniref:ankyrin repeat domain-containing protein n=1 Tax=Aquabacterium sp. A7-Y TaxID=1349605 RepID=UPI00223DC50A|nr:ankyrin repeat domain-containing protein [Aquabacterium sp. A7-Y]MCW7540492.1 ankyrin repeat domain-containing protein [Aquabacterium sp. A7-Y]
MASRALKIGLVVVAVAVVAPAAWVVSKLKASDSLWLLACIQSEKAPVAWVCRQGLYSFHPSPEEVKSLSAEAAMVHAASLKDEAEARRLVLHWKDAGVDINATDERTPVKWTALHSAALDLNPKAVRLLLENGAKVDARDAKGRTPADLARLTNAKFKGEEAQFAEVIRLLEATQTSSR